uniref:Uncharacterized protein n=1 Tax=Arundo donax TaxID=35708 RepID=A0A0A9DPT5_ARUDO
MATCSASCADLYLSHGLAQGGQEELLHGVGSLVAVAATSTHGGARPAAAMACADTGGRRGAAVARGSKGEVALHTHQVTAQVAASSEQIERAGSSWTAMAVVEEERR